MMVEKRRYITEKGLIELYALCQMLPGPTSTQTITALGYRIGGPKLAYLTLLIWALPAVSIMTTAAVIISNFQEKDISLEFTRVIQPVAVGFVAFAAFKISNKVVNTKTGGMLMVFAAIVSYFIRTPYIFPIILLCSGLVTSIKFRKHPKEEKDKLNIQWANFFLWGGVFIFAASLGAITKLLPVRLFENFYRNGSLIFGGGQVLIPMLYTEFVEFKEYLSSQEFLSGFAMVQAVPGPTFSFCAYIGSLVMQDYGITGEIFGALFASAGIFLPGTFLIFFVIRFWESLKKYRPVKASLEGVNAASSGLVAAAAIILFETITQDFISYSAIAITIGLLGFTRIPPPFIILTALGIGLLL